MDARTLLEKAETSSMASFMELAGGKTLSYGRPDLHDW
jgi:hypothetical protein